MEEEKTWYDTRRFMTADKVENKSEERTKSKRHSHSKHRSRSKGRSGTLDKVFDQIILWLFVGMFVLMPVSYGGTLVWSYSVTEVLTAVALLLWGGRLWLNHSHRFFSTPAVWGVLLILAYGFFEYIKSPIEYSARRDTLQLLLYVCLFFLFVNNLKHRKYARIFAFAVISVGTMISIYAVAQFMTGSTSILGVEQPDVYAHRASGTYICPNHLAGFLEMTLPLALALTLAGRLEQYQKILLGFASLVLLAGIAVTVSRAGYVASLCGVALILVTLFNSHKYRIPALAAAALLIVAAAWFLLSKPHAETRFSELMTTTQLDEGRGAIYKSSLEMASKTSLFGRGSGTYASQIHSYLTDKTQDDPYFAHSDYLQLWIEWGLVGVALLAALLIVSGFDVFKIWQYVQRKGESFNPQDSTRSALFLGVTGAVLAILIHSAVDFNMHIPANAMLAVVLFAFLLSCVRLYKDSCWIKQSSANRIAVTTFIVLFSFILVWDAVHTSHIACLVKASEAEGISNKEAQKLLDQAVKLDERNWNTAMEAGRRMLSVGMYSEDPEERERALIHAIGYYSMAIRYNPYHYQLYGGMAGALTLLGRVDEAVPYADKMLTLRPDCYDSNSIYGLCALYRGDYDLAVKHLERSIHLRNEDNDFAKEWYEIAAQRQGEQKKFE
ncbi:MAG: O-antigen ligase family protein [Verrucomicrobia bacterium]|nr:O-antigen ligase family protein [Verrucomicrobiota bacterium]